MGAHTEAVSGNHLCWLLIAHKISFVSWVLLGQTEGPSASVQGELFSRSFAGFYSTLLDPPFEL